MDKYKKVIKPKETAPKDDEEIRVTAVGSVSAYVSRAATVYGELAKSKVVIKAQGNALTKAVTLAEVIKRRFKGLHQISNIGQSEIVDEYEPLEEGLDKVTQTRHIPFVEITLSKEALDTGDKGYQAPIDESLVKELDAEELTKPRGRGGGRGRGKGRGKGKGKSKGKGKGKGDSKGKGKGKGKEAPSKGKGKGKEAPSSKGKGKGKGKEAPSKGKGKGKAEAPKGKGKGKAEPKGKGKSSSKGKDSKGKGKGKSSYEDDWYGWSSSYNKGSSKGSKGKGKSKSKGWW